MNDVALAYHSRTKHHLHRFAASAGYLDWATQPDPFRTYAGAAKVALPLLPGDLQASYRDLHVPGAVPPATLNLKSIGALLELSLGLSAWKQYEQNRWALRCNPSSGNLHPTEGYAIVPALPGLEIGGVYHYASREHELERRAVLDSALLPESTILIGLTSIHWREAWKYGERAFRYCQHDLGHAIAAVRFAAAALGWSATLLGTISDSEMSDVLGLTQTGSFQGIVPEDHEHPGAILVVGPRPVNNVDIAAMREALMAGKWTGQANPLSSGHAAWPVIDEVARATHLAAATPGGATLPSNSPAALLDTRPTVPASQLIRQRRSAVALDDTTSISAQQFYLILDRLQPRPGVPPWDAWPWSPSVHCAIFVHRVDGLAPGLYLLERTTEVHAKVQQAMNPAFLFEKPGGCPEGLRLFRLAHGDFRQQAQVVSCQQKIAGAGAFSLGMLAEFGESIQALGDWWYRRLFWESGLLGHVLYLEAEAAGVRGTGIGCYFDDAFHSMLGLEGNGFQSLYHFTIGGPVEDSRLTTLSGYSHLSR